MATKAVKNGGAAEPRGSAVAEAKDVVAPVAPAEVKAKDNKPETVSVRAVYGRLVDLDSSLEIPQGEFVMRPMTGYLRSQINAGKVEIYKG